MYDLILALFIMAQNSKMAALEGPTMAKISTVISHSKKHKSNPIKLYYVKHANNHNILNIFVASIFSADSFWQLHLIQFKWFCLYQMLVRSLFVILVLCALQSFMHMLIWRKLLWRMRKFDYWGLEILIISGRLCVQGVQYYNPILFRVR